MGQFASYRNIGETFVQRWGGPGVYLVGCLVSATSFFFLLDKVGTLLNDSTGLRSRISVLVVLSTFVLVVDFVRHWAGRATSLGLSRQSPYRWSRRGYFGILLWGLDTGTPVSTVRFTAMPLLGSLLTGLGFGAPLIGLAYFAGLSAALLGPLFRRGPEVGTRVEHLHSGARDLSQSWILLSPIVVLAGGGLLVLFGSWWVNGD